MQFIQEKINWYECDMMDPKSVTKAIRKIKPDIIFRFGKKPFYYYK